MSAADYQDPLGGKNPIKANQINKCSALAFIISKLHYSTSMVEIQLLLQIRITRSMSLASKICLFWLHIHLIVGGWYYFSVLE